MSFPRRISAVCAAALLAAATQASAPFVPNAGHGTMRHLAPDACSLLSDAQVTSTLEVTTLPGKHLSATSTAACIWSNEANAVEGRRVTLMIVSLRAFDFGKSSTSIPTEPAPGVGDDAYYEVFRADSPVLCVKKGDVAFTVRVLDGGKLTSFTKEQKRSKEMTLAQAVAKGL